MYGGLNRFALMAFWCLIARPYSSSFDDGTVRELGLEIIIWSYIIASDQAGPKVNILMRGGVQYGGLPIATETDTPASPCSSLLLNWDCWVRPFSDPYDDDGTVTCPRECAVLHVQFVGLYVWL